MPLPYPQITRLQLCCGDFEMKDIVAKVSAMPQLEVLDVLDQTEQPIDLSEAHTLMFHLPNLREVNLSGSLLWDPGATMEVSQHLRYLPLHVARQLLTVQKAAPHIDWVLGSDAGSLPWE